VAVAVAAVTFVVAAATGCSANGNTAGSDPSTTASAALPTDTTPPTAGGVSTNTAGQVVIDIVLRDGKVEPNGTRIDVQRGQTVVLRVISDHDDEVHVHVDPSVELEVKANVFQQASFVASESGTFEVEAHHPQRTIAQLNIR